MSSGRIGSCLPEQLGDGEDLERGQSLPSIGEVWMPAVAASTFVSLESLGGQ